jgi:hypothetical protein
MEKELEGRGMEIRQYDEPAGRRDRALERPVKRSAGLVRTSQAQVAHLSEPTGGTFQ